MVQIQRGKTNVASSLRSTRLYAVVIAFWVLVIHVVALTFFTSGFLLTRPVVTKHNTGCNHWSEPQFSRAVILIVDALRYDFALPVNASLAESVHYLGKLGLENISNDPRHSVLLKFIADPPTTTLQRLKGLTTGSLPAIIEAGTNFAGSRVIEDNWLLQAKRLGNLAFVGDDTWTSLYDLFDEAYPYPSLNVRDLDTVDNGVIKHLPVLAKNRTNFISIGHMLGVDHVGHRYGPDHPAMAIKLRQVSQFISSLAKALDDDTMLIVFGDHGMDFTGNHGGESKDEVEAAIWFYSKKPVFSSEGRDTVQQIDFVPTISGLLGMPVPFSNLGYPIRQVFSRDQYENISLATAEQLSLYAGEFMQPRFIGCSPEAARQYQQRLLDHFRKSWITFDAFKMYSGIGLMLASIIGMILVYQALNGFNLQRTAARITRYSLCGGVLGGIYIVFAEYTNTFDMCLKAAYFLATGSLFGFLASYNQITFSWPNKWNFLAAIILQLQSCVYFSNSLIIWEARVLYYIFATVFILLLISSLRSNFVVRFLSIRYILWTLLIARLASMLVLCREENSTSCVTTFFVPGSSSPPIWSLFAFSFLPFIFPYAVRKFYTIGGSDVGTATLMFNITLPALLVCVSYWSIDTAEVYGLVSAEAFQLVKTIFARLTLGLGLILGPLIWQRNPPCIKLLVTGNKNPSLGGYGNSYGAYALLVVISLFWAVTITNKPLGALALAGMVCCMFAVLDLMDLHMAKYSLLTPVLFQLLGQMFFYWTGHQATLTSIPWDIAFVASDKISYFFSPLTMTLNILGPFIFSAIFCTLSALWRRQPFKDPRHIIAYATRSGLAISIVFAIQTVASMTATTILRRHLMTWKIFGPRYMLSGMALGAVDISMLIGIVIANHSIDQVTSMFS